MDMTVIINYNTEIGEALYSICLISDTENWIASFKSLKRAVSYCERNKFEIKKLIKGY